jgi:hypothetical protein
MSPAAHLLAGSLRHQLVLQQPQLLKLAHEVLLQLLRLHDVVVRPWLRSLPRRSGPRLPGGGLLLRRGGRGGHGLLGSRPRLPVLVIIVPHAAICAAREARLQLQIATGGGRPGLGASQGNSTTTMCNVLLGGGLRVLSLRALTPDHSLTQMWMP